MTRPIVFLSDYGLTDEFVGVCHGVIARIASDARVIDLAHAVPRQDILRGALMLGRATAYMPSDAVYLAVVDPGVGSERRSIAVRAMSGGLLVGPDNGVLSIGWDALGGVDAAAEITAHSILMHPVSLTFHGRDIFAPAAAHLATGMALEQLGPALDPLRLRTLELPTPMVAIGAVGTRVVGVDRFGNVQLNAQPPDLDAAALGDVLTVGGRQIPRVGTFGDVPEGQLASIVDSHGQVSLIVNGGSAAEVLGLRDGSAVVLE
jgi:S-adenosyl-L-methionine hydrolase (adenosine-forming)